MTNIWLGKWRYLTYRYIELIFFGSEMYKSDPITLTNQPETDTAPPPSSSRVMGCWGVGRRLNLLRTGQPKWTNWKYSCSAVCDGRGEIDGSRGAAMKPTVQQMLALGPGGVWLQGGRCNSQYLRRYGRFCPPWCGWCWWVLIVRWELGEHSGY